MRLLFVSLFIVIADQITKLFVKGFSIPFLDINVSGMHYGESIDIIGSLVRFTYVENPGMAFGLDLGEGSKLFLSLFSIIASIALIYYLFKIQDRKLPYRLAIAFILGGAIGNLIDRTFYGVFYGYDSIFYGRVVDFISIDFFDFTLFGHTYERWPIFNIADSFVTIGVFMLIIFHRKPHKAKEDNIVKTTAEEKIDTIIIEDKESEKFSTE
ncbi:MAG: signal peptidase II [Ignavibacteriales bacterium]|nr:signal peptidase II [Ignavibacteriales bacterium]